MGFLDNIRTWLVQPVFDRWGMVDAEMQRRLFELALQREYVAGNQRPQLPVKAGKPDDNIAVNLTGKVVKKSVSMLVGGEVRFDLGDGNEEKQEWLDALWERNRKPIFLKKLATTAATYGTGYIKIVPDGSEDMNIRLISLPPIAMRIITPPTDPEVVLEYQQYWMAEDERGKQRVYRERTVKNEAAGWTIINEVEGNGAKWEQLSSIEWDYPFAPIVHGQNLPVDGSPYGDSDVSGVIDLQDRINYVASNISKIIRYHAHPRTIGKGFRVGGDDGNVVVNGEPVGGGEPAEMAGDQMFILPNAEGDVWNLEMQSDLASSMAYLQFLIQSLYDIAATVNMSNIKDKLGQLTNFAIQVLYQDAMEKLQDKRDLFGEMLREVNRRLLVLQYGDDESGGKVIWPPDVTPQNSREEAEELTMDLNNGLVSHQTASHLRGYDWDVEQERMVDERAQTDGELGAQLLAAFNRGQ